MTGPRFTMSKDGVPRVSMRIPFRVDVSHFEHAAATVVWKAAVDMRPPVGDALEEAAADIARTLTRADVLEQVRGNLASDGYGGDGLGEDDYFAACHAAARPYVRQWWPEAYERRD